MVSLKALQTLPIVLRLGKTMVLERVDGGRERK
jgi:hypothetical protein